MKKFKTEIHVEFEEVDFDTAKIKAFAVLNTCRVACSANTDIKMWLDDIEEVDE